MKKSSKRFVISSELKNKNGFRLRTSGIDLSDYNANPIMLWMHQRPKGESKDEILPIGNMVDLQFKDGKLLGTPAFDESDEFAMKLYEKVENGTIRMVSPGIIPLTWGKENNEVWLETSKLFEISLVDIGSNSEALGVALYDQNTENIITLSLDEIITKIKPDLDMKLIQLNAPEVLPLLKLADGATPEEVQAAIGNLVTLAAKTEAEILSLTAARDDFKLKFEAEVKLASDAKIVALVNQAVTDRKILEGTKETYIKLAMADYDSTKSLLDGMNASPTVASQMRSSEQEDEFEKLSWKDLDQKGMLEKLKAANLDLFKLKFEAEFKKPYSEKK